jgi:cell surface protein SprA
LIKTVTYSIKITFACLLFFLVREGEPALGRSLLLVYPAQQINPPDTNQHDTIQLKYPFSEDMTLDPNASNLYLKNPANLKTEVVYDPITKEYVYQYKIGNMTYRVPVTMSFDEYQDADMQKILDKYWQERSTAASMDQSGGLIPKIHIPGKVFETIFGNNTVDIRPQGSAEISFGIVSNKRDDPMLTTRQRRQTNFDFQEKIQMNVIAKIGDKIEFKVNYNTEATFDFENKLKLKYEGKEDAIIQLIEAGDVNMPLSSTLIKGTESLFGIKTKLRFGRVSVTAVYSQQRSESKNITVQGNAQMTKFSIKADEYEENKHYYIAQYFRKNFKPALQTLPIISSNVNILKIEVWITNVGAAVTENRNIVAFKDLGEVDPQNKAVFLGNPAYPYPTNQSNNLYSVIMPTPADSSKVRNINTVSDYLNGPPFFLISGEDYLKVESARKLLPTEFTYNSRLGFISLNTMLNPDQTLAVAFQYQVVGDTAVYQVGEFSDRGIQAPQCLIVKLLKSPTINTNSYLWKLMMKNVYALGAYQIQPTDFMLNILYSGNRNGVPTAYITESRISGVPLLRVLNFDNLNQQKNPPGDGMFDFIDQAATMGGTIQAATGRIFFTVPEPFGQDLRDSIYDPNDPKGSLELASKYCYDSLYTMTKTMARQYPEKNKFTLDGYYKSSSGSEISLNALNVPQGSVRVTAGGMQLTENVDYTVDYTLGRVRIINDGILNSGTPINISLESTEMFNIQTKRLMGAHVDYKFNKDFNVGATVMNLNVRPLTQKVGYGDEPINNTVWGFNLTYRTQSRLITRLVDALPFITTKAVSNVAIDAEFAQFFPGHSKAIGSEGTSYIDDFEQSRASIDLKNMGNWFMASTPQGQTGAKWFPEGATGTGLAYGYNRAKFAWYMIDPLFYDRNSSLVPPNITKDELSQNSVRQVWETEVFPNKEPVNGVPVNLSILNLAYYPTEKGAYNYDLLQSPFSKGISTDGSLNNPETRWGGIMRKIETSDFDATNIQYIEFWMMDPFSDDSTISGQLYFNLGDISEDILRDSRKSYENGLPTSELVTNVDTTFWGRVPSVQALVDAFDNTPESRPYQDVGYDGLRDQDELSFFDTSYMARLASYFGTASQAYLQASQDPSADDYHYFRGTDYDNDPLYSSVLERYKKFNGTEGNSPSSANSPESYPTSATTLPNIEDINKDNTLSESEQYYQYVVQLRPEMMKPGQNYITNVYHATDISLANGQKGNVNWYQFKIPIRQPDKTVGAIKDFTSIRFMRMFFKGFNKPIVCRFATLELTRQEWRRYTYDLLSPGEYLPDDNQNQVVFDLSTVSLEENGSKQPIPYVIPPGIQRETNWASTNQQKLNEQSMAFNICNLIDGDARAAYKTSSFDFRQFKRLQMFVHAEQSLVGQNLKNGDLTVFIRLGSDFTENYYEYEIPLTFTPWGTRDPDIIWPESNSFDIDLEELAQTKLKRLQALRVTTTGIPFVTYDGKNKITLVGSPTTSDVKAIMIGIRNPKKSGQTPDDDGQAKCAEIWVDELRLTDYNKKGGWAATARIASDLADLGRVQVSTSYSSAGYGNIDQKQTDRLLASLLAFGFDTDIDWGKFFKQKTGIKIPMHFDYSILQSTPEYDPLNPDLYFKDVLDLFSSKQQRDSVRAQRDDYTYRKNFNLMNVRKDRTGDKKVHVYDIENFDVSYTYSEIFHRNIDIEYDLMKKYTGALGYNYSVVPKMVQPFAKSKFLNKNKGFQLIKEFNFYYLPKSFTFRTDMLREYNERKFRNKSVAIIPMETYYLKKWDWNRLYDLKYDLARSLKFSLVANANSFINEPPGRIDKSAKDQIWSEIFNGGSMTTYTQQFSATYEVPLQKIPFLEWTQLMMGYQANYRWYASPLSVQPRFGNSIENSNNKLLNGSVNMVTLYNKIPYLKKINQATQGRSENRGPSQRQNLPDKNKPKQDSVQLVPKFNLGKFLLEGSVRFLMAFRKANFSYTQGNGIFLPGFVPEPQILGNNWTVNAPGLDFVFGGQKDIRGDAASNHWMTLDTLLNTAYSNKFNENLTINATVEPFKDFRIELTATRTYSKNHTEYWKANPDGVFESYSPVETGSFTMSYIIIGTSFVKDGANNTSPLFQKMQDIRLQIAQRYAEQNPWSTGVNDSTGYPLGYGPTDQEVLTTAFLAAYTGMDPAKIYLTAFPTIPLPNWRLTYDGLSRIKAFKKVLRTLTLSHAYISTYSVGNFSSNIHYREQDGSPTEVNTAGNFIPKAELSVITITEQFNPLIKFDMAWINSLLSNIEWRRSRNISFSFVNNQLTEVQTSEFVVGLGYRFKNVKLSFLSLGTAGKKSKYASDLNLKFDFSVRNNKTILRRIDEPINQISTGQRAYSIDFTADYNLSQRFNIRFYFNKLINEPYVSNQYRTSNTKGGITLRFTLAQ